jgi:hypothetical protein
VLASSGLFGVVYGLVRSQSQGWTKPEIVIALAVGGALVIGFVIHELRTREPMLPMSFFANRGFAVTNGPSSASCTIPAPANGGGGWIAATAHFGTNPCCMKNNGNATTYVYVLGGGQNELNGHVTNAKHKPLAGVQVNIDGSGGSFSATTDKDGAYSALLGDGDYTVTAGRGFAPQSRTVHLSGNGEQTVDFVAEQIDAGEPGQSSTEFGHLSLPIGDSGGRGQLPPELPALLLGEGTNALFAGGETTLLRWLGTIKQATGGDATLNGIGFTPIHGTDAVGHPHDGVVLFAEGSRQQVFDYLKGKPRDTLSGSLVSYKRRHVHTIQAPSGTYRLRIAGIGKGLATLVIRSGGKTEVFSFKVKRGQRGSIRITPGHVPAVLRFGGKKVHGVAGVPLFVSGIPKKLHRRRTTNLHLKVRDQFGVPVRVVFLAIRQGKRVIGFAVSHRDGTITLALKPKTKKKITVILAASGYRTFRKTLRVRG